MSDINNPPVPEGPSPQEAVCVHAFNQAVPRAGRRGGRRQDATPRGDPETVGCHQGEAAPGSQE